METKLVALENEPVSGSAKPGTAAYRSEREGQKTTMPNRSNPYAPARPQAGAACFDDRPPYLAPDSGFILQPSSFTLSASGSTANPRPFRLRRSSDDDRNAERHF